jgi:DNA mismatch repair protein MutS2
MASSNTLQQLEFDKLLKLISGFANSGATEAAVAKLGPFSSYDEILARQNLIGDILRLYSEGVSLGLSPFSDIGPLFARVRPEGAVLEGIELAGFSPVLGMLEDISTNLAGQENIPALRQLAENLTGFPDLHKTLARSLDSEGNILDTASAALAGLRGEIRKIEARIRRKLEEMTRSETVSVFLQDDFVTTRSGRWVIPVRMDSKGQVAGVVHDISKSGETAFVEPVAIISLSNELENLNAEQKAEEIRILRNISSRIREQLEEIGAQFRSLVHLDMLNSAAAFSIQLKMSIPEINTKGFISLSNARHPLLSVAFQRYGGGRQVVPLTVGLGGDSTVMVITGVNAGGKTITIKTIGLLTLMALSGLPIPADSSSSIPLVSDLLIDIGDEQSIENDLSTFSAHIGHIAGILTKADSRALILIDELGTGTDPSEGAAIACAVLNEIMERGSLLFATTHLMDIKGFVHRTPGMLNSSMEFDRKTLTPLYRLRTGEPGQSHAIEIAQRYGLPDSIIDSARALLGGVRVEFDNLIRDLAEKRAYYEKASEDVDRLKAELEERDKQLQDVEVSSRREREALLAKAYSDAADFVTGVKRELNALLDEAKKADRQKIKESLKAVDVKQKEIQKSVSALMPVKGTVVSIDDIAEGDTVYIRSIEASAEVVGIDKRHERIRVKRGSVEVEVPFVGISKGKKPPKETILLPTTAEANAAGEQVESTLNIVGLRVDDALVRIEPFLDRAALVGARRISIIHGVGTGALMKSVRDFLKGHPLVESFRSEEQGRGGKGVTVVLLK